MYAERMLDHQVAKHMIEKKLYRPVTKNSWPKVPYQRFLSV